MTIARMMVFPVLAVISVFWGEVGFAKIGFESGSNFEAHTIEGNVTVFCMENGQTTVGHHLCRAGVITPSGWQYFMGEQDLSADKVFLRSTQASGKVREKKFKYDASKNRTKKRVNLWTDTLLQRSLLDFGENEIEYAFLLDGQSVNSGSFIATVDHGEDLQCRDRTYHIRAPSCRRFDVCTRYFRDENNCEY